MRAGRCLPRRRSVFMADLASDPLPPFEADEGFQREAEAVERGERFPIWHAEAPRTRSERLDGDAQGDRI